MHKLLIIFLALCSCSRAPNLHKLAICAIFKDEAPWLKEWVTYHHKVLGVEKFYLYNNESKDNYLEVLKPFLDKDIVELIDWESSNPKHLAFGAFMDSPWSAAQLGAYNDCLKNRALGKAKWVAMIDIDEFIVPTKGVKSFYALLNQAEKNKKGTISLYWRVFGTSGVKELEDHELLTEKLTRRADDDHPWNQLVKSIHQPEAIEFCLIHVAEKLKPGFGARTLKPEKVRINHYWTRTENFCFQKRQTRKDIEPGFFKSFEVVEDNAIEQYLPILKSSI